ncbi:MAG: M23 family metallopeptidase [Chloroflexi bacterium]|nr:M23 family metallopeptidase [Chloroflexota bacterium]
MKKNRNITLIIVPHNESATLTLSFPRWLAPSLAAIVIALLLVVGYLLVRYRQLSERYDQVVQAQSVESDRSRGMRSIILSQQGDVKQLSDEVRQIQSELDGIRKLSDQVRQLLGLPKGPSPVIPAPTPQSYIPGVLPQARGGGSADPLSASSGSMLLAVESAQVLDALQPSIPWAAKELQYLASQSLLRVSKIDPTKRGSQSELEAQLKLLAAAPTLWPVRGRITSEFGWRKALFDDTKREFHTGLDIGVWYFTPVKATKEGTVIYAGWAEGYGNLVEIAHDLGYVTYYGHNSSLKVKVGQTVQAGDVVALSGQSGYANGPHVHYEVRLRGQALDPMRFLDLAP